jgi:hypothetical protein
MARLTKQQRVEKFHYALRRFNKSMEEYEKYLATTKMCENRRNVTEKNDQGLSIEAKKQAVSQWKAHEKKSAQGAADRMAAAIEAFDNMKKLME